MKIQNAEFITSSTHEKQCPKPDKPEYAFIGRSNVGKSSLVNMLTNRKKLAKISSNPGKTITMNHFIINKEWYLVDLPGYGYAKRSKSERAKWEKMIKQYLLTRTNLLTVFLLIDLRIEPQKIDLEFMEWLATSQIPFVITFTKVDKVGGMAKIDGSVEKYKNTLLENWEEVPPMLVTSSQTSLGKEELLSYIEKTNKVFGL
ncbi:MAG: YihA family ribosome biogenesis GTP-binding protein [Bacteroidales bacterium]|nr:YihA family ribosome biogenesis GTP-binding protein [Bacteroidales bacterium]